MVGGMDDEVPGALTQGATLLSSILPPGAYTLIMVGINWGAGH